MNRHVHGARRALKIATCGGALLALLIGCSTSVDSVDDGPLGTVRQASMPSYCADYPTDPSCENYGTPSSTPSAPGGAVANTTYWRIEHAGWQLTINPPAEASPASYVSSDDTLKATFTMSRTSSATTSSSRAFGAAIVRAIPRPIAGGTFTTTCTSNADCYADGVVAPLSDGSFNYCVKVGTSMYKTCVQRPGTVPNWQKIVTPADVFSLNQTKSYTAPIATAGAPYGTTATVGGSDQYSTMAALNVVGSVSYYDATTGTTKTAAPCTLTNVNGPNGVPYEEDPAYCFKLVRPWLTFTKWVCGDGDCNGTETSSSCAADCICDSSFCIHYPDDPQCAGCY